jgi:hypothetical protein
VLVINSGDGRACGIELYMRLEVRVVGADNVLLHVDLRHCSRRCNRERNNEPRLDAVVLSFFSTKP